MRHARRQKRDLDRFRWVGGLAHDLLTLAKERLLASNSPRGLVEGVIGGEALQLPRLPRWLSFGVGVNDRYVNNLWYSSEPFLEGDVVAMEIGLDIDGYYLEVAESMVLGTGCEIDLRLVEVTAGALRAAIAAAVVGNSVRDISAAIQKHVEGDEFYVSLLGAGHAIEVDPFALDNRTTPWIPNRVDVKVARVGQTVHCTDKAIQKSLDTRLKPGMCLSLEPMVNATSDRVKSDALEVHVPKHGCDIRFPFWRTSDGGKTAKFVHCVYLTEEETVVLTGPSLIDRPDGLYQTG